jgi:hypothetical protein
VEGDFSAEAEQRAHVLEGEQRPSKNGGLEEKFGGACKMEDYLKVLLELDFCTKPPNWRRGPYEGLHWSCSKSNSNKLCIIVAICRVFQNL